MIFQKMSTDSKDYVVIDVETSGVSIKWDLLSISIYKPDDNKTYERFLPLELHNYIPLEAKQINGIKEDDLTGLLPLSQEEIDKLFEDFELDKRVILHYGQLDEKFIKNYFKRHSLKGYERMNFYNFKKLVCSHAFPKAVVSKDNLCKMYNIDGVSEIHSGSNDCLLEWELFKKINGFPILAKNESNGIALYELTNDFVIPVSFINYYSRLASYFNLPRMNYKVEEVFEHRLYIDEDMFTSDIERYIIQSLKKCNCIIHKYDNRNYIDNYLKNFNFIGSINNERISVKKELPVYENYEERRKKFFEEYYKRFDSIVNYYLEKAKPLFDYIKQQIFCNNNELKQNELVVNELYKVSSICYLSNTDSVLEIQHYSVSLDRLGEKMFYESKGRVSYALKCNYVYKENSPSVIDYIDFKILKLDFDFSEKVDRIEKTKRKLQERLKQDINVINYKDSKTPVLVKCEKCGCEWETTYDKIMYHNVVCKMCINKEKEKTINADKK